MKKKTFLNGLKDLLMTMDAVESDYEVKVAEIFTYMERCGIKAPSVKATFNLTKANGEDQPSFSYISRWEK